MVWPSAKIPPVLPLPASDVFTTAAWCGHLRFKASPLWLAVLAGRPIASIEHRSAVPANRLGHGACTAAEPKTMQEATTLAVSAVFPVAHPGGAPTWNHAVGFGLVAFGASFVFRGPFR